MSRHSFSNQQEEYRQARASFEAKPRVMRQYPVIFLKECYPGVTDYEWQLWADGQKTEIWPLDACIDDEMRYKAMATLADRGTTRQVQELVGKFEYRIATYTEDGMWVIDLETLDGRIYRVEGEWYTEAEAYARAEVVKTEVNTDLRENGIAIILQRYSPKWAWRE